MALRGVPRHGRQADAEPGTVRVMGYRKLSARPRQHPQSTIIAFDTAFYSLALLFLLAVPVFATRGLKSKLLASLFSISIIIGIGFFYVMIQSNSIALAATGLVDINPLFPAIALVALVGTIIFGGVKRITEVAKYLVPFKAMTYILIALFVMAMNIGKLPDVISLIFRSAFNFESAVGGVAGHTIHEAFRFGVARGLFSNDAGNGTAPSMHATAVVKHPVNQGLTAMLGTFITTIIVCSCTAFCILLTGALDSGQTGILLTQETFRLSLGEFGKYVVFLSMFFFGFTTLMADILRRSEYTLVHK